MTLCGHITQRITNKITLKTQHTDYCLSINTKYNKYKPNSYQDDSKLITV